MKNKIWILAVLAASLLTGCKEQTDEMKNDPLYAEEKDGSLQGELHDSDMEVVGEESQSYEEEAQEEIQGQQEHYVVLDNPSWLYYLSQEAEQRISSEGGMETDSGITLRQQLEEPNEIIDEEVWFSEYQIENPGFPYEDEEYLYERMINADGAPCLVLTGKDGTSAIYDLTNYRYADVYEEKDYGYIDQTLFYAAVQDHILYMATGHVTYAASCPHTAYLTAVDLETDEVLWKSEPLTCNSSSFVIVDQYLICGYGFTEEEDYLKLVDIRNGKVTEQILVKSKPEYIVRQGDLLLVRTYDTNYEFEIMQWIACADHAAVIPLK